MFTWKTHFESIRHSHRQQTARHIYFNKLVSGILHTTNSNVNLMNFSYLERSDSSFFSISSPFCRIFCAAPQNFDRKEESNVKRFIGNRKKKYNLQTTWTEMVGTFWWHSQYFMVIHWMNPFIPIPDSVRGHITQQYSCLCMGSRSINIHNILFIMKPEQKLLDILYRLNDLSMRSCHILFQPVSTFIYIYIHFIIKLFWNLNCFSTIQLKYLFIASIRVLVLYTQRKWILTKQQADLTIL